MCVCKRVGPPLKWFSFIDFLLLIKKQQFVTFYNLNFVGHRFYFILLI